MKNRFYETLFRPNELTCFGATAYETAVRPVSDFVKIPDYNFFCINPLSSIDNNPTKPQHHKSVGRRADANVTAFRNILLEFDKGELNEQRMELEKSDAPWTTLTFSGGKSLHAIISLQDGVRDAAEYRALVHRIYKLLPSVDRSTSNPSRFSRTPGARRGDVVQELLEVREAVSASALEAWLGPAPILEPEPPRLTGERILRASTNYFLMAGAPNGGWNNSLFKAVCDMVSQGYSEHEVVALCSAITGTLDSNDMKTIKSAIRAGREKCG